MFTDEIKQSLKESVLCWLATVSADGVPNVSPKEMFVPYGDDCILIANIASPKSVANIEINSAVCVSFVEVFKQKGFKLTGNATLVKPSDVEFETLKTELYSLGGEGFKIISVIKIKVTQTEPIVAPSYWLFSETTESSQITQAMNAYGVRPK